ncbi:hypothetical protein BLNAU_18178 [Blattamonas nauphoetae]|uniref:Uncharacterized protein n=1 Tax=Blattamonas nauphoetae TaxID=2049346 RepID=A0ABQ9X531_9EUKA|nr:hypothetical protein BLNAU_18178 [Blattamonas nauphoetae]
MDEKTDSTPHASWPVDNTSIPAPFTSSPMFSSFNPHWLSPLNPTHSPPFAVLLVVLVRRVFSSADGTDAVIALRGRHSNAGTCPLSPLTPTTPTSPYAFSDARFGVVSSCRRICYGQRLNGAWKGFAMEGEDCAIRH